MTMTSKAQGEFPVYMFILSLVLLVLLWWTNRIYVCFVVET